MREDNRSLSVSSQIWYKVGSAYEPRGLTGISHALEHMMFQGTPSVPSQIFFNSIAEKGGKQNAFTTKDYTAYYQTINANELELIFKLEADRMAHLNFPEFAIMQELGVVKEERRLRTDDNPKRLAYERFNMNAFMGGPYSHPVVGWMRDLNNLKIQDLERWYKTWYAPNNAVVVVAGNVKAESVLKLAQQYFGPITPNAHDYKALASVEEEPVGERHMVVRLQAKVPHLYLGYNVPSLKAKTTSKEIYTLKLLEVALGKGRSSRFNKMLVRGEELATSVHTHYQPFTLYPTLLEVSACPAPNVKLEKVEAAIIKQINLLKEELIENDELQRIKNRVIANRIFARDSLFYQASELASLEAVGLPWELSQQYENDIQAIDAKTLQEVAIKYLEPNRLTVTYLLPIEEEIREID